MAMSRPPEPPGDAPVTEPEPPGRPRRRTQWAGALTVEDFRSVRRWLAAIGIVAVLGTAIAIFALVKAYESEQEAADRERVVQLERTLRSQLAELETALNRAGEEADVARLGREIRRRAEEADVARLDRRVRQLEAQLSSIQQAAANTEASVDDLGGRVSDLAEELQARPRGP
jgi:hypothetical protein